MNKFRTAAIGLAVGDALGLPVEFTSRWQLAKEPVTELQSFQSHFQPKGTWSTSTSLLLVMMSSLSKGINYGDMLQQMLLWKDQGKFTPHNETIDVPLSLYNALNRYEKGIDPLKCGGIENNNNTNTILPRMLPLAYYLNLKLDPFEWQNTIENSTKITHGHPLSIMASYLMVDLFIEINYNEDPFVAIQKSLDHLFTIYQEREDYNESLVAFQRLSNLGEFLRLDSSFIHSSHYVIDTLEAVVYCILSTDNYKDAVLMAVNLGNQTAVIGALTSSIAAIIYGYENIVDEFLINLINRDEIEEAVTQFMSSI